MCICCRSDSKHSSWDWVLKVEGNSKDAHQVLQRSGTWYASLVTDLFESGATNAQ